MTDNQFPFIALFSARFLTKKLVPSFVAACVLLLSQTVIKAAFAKGGAVRVDVELILAVDISRSMDPEEQRLQRAGYVQALSSPDFINAIKNGINGKIVVTYFQWASDNDNNILLPWTVIDSAQSAKAAAEKLAAAPYRRARRTSISGAINKAMSMFTDNGFNGLRQVIDISGDGTNNDGQPVVEARAVAIKQGITINGLPLMVRTNNFGFADISNLDEYYADCVTGGLGSFVIPIRSRKQFIRATRTKLVLEIAGLLPGIRNSFSRQQAGTIKTQAGIKRTRVNCLIGEIMLRRRWR